MAVFYLKRIQWFIQDTWRSLVGKSQDEGGFAKYDELDEVSEETEAEKIRKHGPRSAYILCENCRCQCPCACSARYTIAILSSIGFLISFGIRCNMGVAILKMTRNESSLVGVTSSDWSNITNTTTNTTSWSGRNAPEFNWSPGTKGLIDSSFFWGYILTQIPGGYLAGRYPANKIFGTAIAISSFLNLFIPATCMVHPAMVMAVRILQGLVEGVTYPACHGIWRHWAPPLERSRLATITLCGSYAGAVLGMPLSGILTDYLGWQACFYVYGIMGMSWYIVWHLMSAEKPSMDKRISEEERIYIESTLSENTSLVSKKKKVPTATLR